MRLHLEFAPDMAVLTIVDGGERVEVRGNPAVGSKYIGDMLDRIVAAIPRTVNISELFADEVVHVRPDNARIIRGQLAEEDRLQALMLGSCLK